jgi:hypothetical protein
MSSGPQDTRPYFIPSGIDFLSLPLEIQLVLKEKIEPMYQEMVLGARSALEASNGMSHVFLSCVEVLEQYQLAQAEFESLAQGGSDPGERQARREPYFRLHGAKQKSISAQQRMDERRKSLPPGPPGLLRPESN